MLLRLGFTAAYLLFAFCPSLAVWSGTPAHPRAVSPPFQNCVAHATVPQCFVAADAPTHFSPRVVVDGLNEPAPKPLYLQARYNHDLGPAYNPNADTRQDKKKRSGFAVPFASGHSLLAVVLVQAARVGIQAAYTVPPDDRDAPGKRADDPRASPVAGRRDETAG